jgi:hypothetical protein
MGDTLSHDQSDASRRIPETEGYKRLTLSSAIPPGKWIADRSGAKEPKVPAESRIRGTRVRIWLSLDETCAFAGFPLPRARQDSI